MINLDNFKAQKAEVLAKISQAIKDGNEEAFAVSFSSFADIIQNAVMAEASGMLQAADVTVLAGRGVRALTSDETKYYQAVIGAMKSSNPRQALTDITITMPLTVIDAVLENLTEAHPLLEEIDFVNTSGLVEYLVNTNVSRTNMATWQALTATIVTEAVGGFKKISLGQKKLSAFLPISKSMLDLGAVWVDKYVRTVLQEALFNGLEDGIISGDGLLEPIGMIRNLDAAVDPVTGYVAKVAVAVTSFDKAAYGALVAALSAGPNGNNRVINEVILIVNPVDYLTKVMPATTHLVQGVYINNVFPIPTKVIQSSVLTAGSAIIGVPKQYFMGLGTAKEGKIEYSDEYRFLEDERVYLVKLYGNGMPKDNAAFKLLDISALAPAVEV